MKKTVLIIAVILVLIVSGAFFLSSTKVKQVDEKSATNVSTVEISGTVKPPSGFKSTDFEIVALGAITNVKNEGTFTANISSEGVSTIAAMQKGKEFGLLKIFVHSSTTPAEVAPVIDATSTAVALVFITPFFATHDPAQAEATLTVIEKDPKVHAFAEVISQVMPGSDPVGDPRYVTAFKTALESVIATTDHE